MTSPSLSSFQQPTLQPTPTSTQAHAKAGNVGSKSQLMRIGILLTGGLLAKSQATATPHMNTTASRSLQNGLGGLGSTSTGLQPMRDIESYSASKSSYPNLVDYDTMQRDYAGPSGALALKVQDPETGDVRGYLPFCSAWLYADDAAGSAGHCDVQKLHDLSETVSFLSCYQTAYPEGDSVLSQDPASAGQLRNCYAFDVIDTESILYNDPDFTGTDEPGGFRLSAVDFLSHTLEGEPGKLFGTYALNFDYSLPTFINHHSNGAPEQHSAVSTIELSENNGIENWIFKGDMNQGSSGAAILDENGAVTGTLSWGNSEACTNETYSRDNLRQPIKFEDNQLIRRNLQASDDPCIPPEAVKTFFEREDCVIGGQTLSNILAYLPSETRDYLLENAAATPASWDFSAFKSHMVDCLCAGDSNRPVGTPAPAPLTSAPSTRAPTPKPSTNAPTITSSSSPAPTPKGQPETASPADQTLSPAPTPNLRTPSPSTASPVGTTTDTPTSKPTDKGGKKNHVPIIAGAVGGTIGLTALLYGIYKVMHNHNNNDLFRP